MKTIEADVEAILVQVGIAGLFHAPRCASNFRTEQESCRRQIALRRIVSRRVVSYRIVSYRIVSYHIVSYRIAPAALCGMGSGFTR